MTVHTLLKAESNLYPIYSSSGVVLEPAGGVAPIGWVNLPAVTLIDKALDDYEVIWAAAGYPHAVFPTSYSELMSASNATEMVVGD